MQLYWAFVFYTGFSPIRFDFRFDFGDFGDSGAVEKACKVDREPAIVSQE